MAQAANEIWESFTITPCYQIYSSNKHTTLGTLHVLWEEYTDNYLSPDIEYRVQGWQGVMALVRLFHERGEWDQARYAPYPLRASVPLWKKWKLTPKTDEWMKHWITYPEEQPSMSKHVGRLRKKADNEN